MKNTKKRDPWTPKPGEPNPHYVAFVLYLALGPNRERIISKGVGNQLWNMLMSGIGSMEEDTPLPLVCTAVSATLKNMTREDALDRIDSNSSDFSFFKSFHKGLHDDEQLLAAIEAMLAALKKVKRGQKLPRPSNQSGSEVVRDVERFLNKKRYSSCHHSRASSTRLRMPLPLSILTRFQSITHPRAERLPKK